MEQAYKNCQSCRIPLKKSPNGGGTCADGSISKMYCSYCYENGMFKQSAWTVTEMKAFVKERMKEMGFPGLLAGSFTKGIPKLECWKTKN
jgi:Putative zinc ribbon domain